MSNPNGRPPKFSKEEIIESYRRTKSMTKTAAEIGCSQPYVLKVLKEAGVERDGKAVRPGSKPRHTRQEVIECREKLGSVKAAAKELGYSKSHFYYILRTPTSNNGSI